MAVSFYYVNEANGTGSVGTVTPTGGSTSMVIFVASETTVTHDTVTFNGVSATKRAQDTQGSDVTLSAWTVDNAASDAGDVVVTFSGSCTYWIQVINYNGSDGYHASATNKGSSTTPSCTLTPVAGHMMVDALGILAGGTVVATNAAAQTNRNVVSSGAGIRSCASEKMATVSADMSWTLDTSSPWVHIIVEILHTPVYASATGSMAFSGATTSGKPTVTVGWGQVLAVNVDSSESLNVEAPV